MKKISKITGVVLVFLLILCKTCFADIAVADPKNKAVNDVVDNAQSSGILTYAIIGALIGVVVVCAIMVIKSIVEKKKEK